MKRIFTSLLLLAVLILDGGAAAPIPDKEAITLILEALLQKAYAEPTHQDVQKVNTIAQQFPMKSQQFPMKSQQFPMESQQFPMKSQQFPMKSQQFPMKSQQFPMESQQFPKQYTAKAEDKDALARLQYFIQ